MVSITRLWTSLKETIENLGIISLISILVIIFILIILVLIERKLRARIHTTTNITNIYIQKINQIKKTNPENILKQIDKIAKGFFKDRFKVKRSISYFELNNLFTKQKNTNIAKFCVIMSDLLYSGKRIDNKINQSLIIKLTEIIKHNPAIHKQPKIRKSKKFWSKFKKFKSKIKSQDVEVSSINKEDLKTK